MSEKIQIIDRQAAYLLVTRIVEQASADWKDAMKILAKHPESVTAGRRKKDCERFFLSKHFIALTGVDGKHLLNRLEKEYNHDC